MLGKMYNEKDRASLRSIGFNAKKLEETLDRMHREVEEKMREFENRANGDGDQK